MKVQIVAGLALMVAFTSSCDASASKHKAAASHATANSNPVIGDWKLVDPSCEVMKEIIYSPTEWAGFESPDGVFPGWRKLPVTYNVSATEVWILPVGYSNETKVAIIDGDHIKPDDGDGCIYQRAG